MQLIAQSSFLQAVSFALLNSIWQMALLWLMLVLIVRTVKLSAAQKFNIAFIAQLTGFIFFIYSLVHSYTTDSSFIVFQNHATIITSKLQNVLAQSMCYISIVYIIVLIWQLIKLLFSYHSTQQLRRFNLTKMPVQHRLFVQHVTAMLSLKKQVKISLSSVVKCPLTIGFFKPVILVPLAAVNNLTNEQMEAVILHEMAHIKRDDYLLNLIQLCIEKIFFFNIFSKLISDIIERERENACDDFVLQFKYNAFHYVEALLKLGKLQTMSSLAMAVSGKKENTLLLRVKRLIHGSNEKINYGFSVLTQSFFALTVALLLMMFSIKSNHANQNTTTAKVTNIIPVMYAQPVVANINTASAKAPSSKIFIERKIRTSVRKEVNNKPETAMRLNDVQPSLNLISVNQPLDSLKQLAYTDASSRNLVLNNDSYQKVLSYQNFKQLEAMLYAGGNKINITEDPTTKDSYKKLITIEATDAKGIKNVYKVVVELYQ